MVLVRGADDAAAPGFVRVVRDAPGPGGEAALLLVRFDAPALREAPTGARVLLVNPEEHADWLNLNRPVIAARRLTLLLWCGPEAERALQAAAPDLMDWVSHAIELPPMWPPFLERALAAATGPIAVGHAPPPPAGWTPVTATDRFATLRDACRTGPVWVTGVADAVDRLTARLAHAQAGAPHPLVLADPAVIAPGDAWVDARPVPWREASAWLAAQGEADPALVAAARELDPAALGAPRPGPLELVPDPRWAEMEAAAREGPGLAAIQLAATLGLAGVAAAWAEEGGASVQFAWRRQQALAARAQDGADAATAILRDGAAWAHASGHPWLEAGFHLEDAAMLLERGRFEAARTRLTKDVIPIYARLGDVVSMAIAKVRLADASAAAGDTDAALHLLRDEAIPALAKAGDRDRRARAYIRLAVVHIARGEQEDAVRVLQDGVLGPEAGAAGLTRAEAQLLLARIDVARGELDRAAHRLIRHILPALPVEEAPGQRAAALDLLAAIRIHQGAIDDALPLLDLVAAIDIEHGSNATALVTKTAAALALLRRGAPDDRYTAIRLLREAHAAAVTRGHAAEQRQIEQLAADAGLSLEPEPGDA